MVMTILCSLVWLLMVPVLLGIPMVKRFGEREQSISTVVLVGTIAYISLFQVMYVFFLLFYNEFSVFAYVFAGITLVTSVIIAVKERADLRKFVGTISLPKKEEWILWGMLGLMIGYQLYRTVAYQFVDGDDAYYVPTAVATMWRDYMYGNLPYTGYTTSIDLRHGFSGAPIFVGYLARMCMAHPAMIHHVVLSVAVLLGMYMIYYKIGEVLFRKETKQIPIFLIVISALYLYGNTSIYTAATFALTRTSQGKSMLSNLILPFTGYVLIRIYQKLEARTSYVLEIWLLAAILMVAGFASMLGLALVPLMTAPTFVILAIRYRTWKLLLYQVVMVLPTYLLCWMFLKVLWL